MRRFLLSLLPLALGLIGSALVTGLNHPEPVLVFRLGVGMAMFLAGLALTAFLLVWQTGQNRGENKTSTQANRWRRDFIRRLDHELKNPLTGLRAGLANFSEATTETDRGQAVEHARRDVQRLTGLLADLRKLSDLEERQLERYPVQLPEILNEIVEAVTSLPQHQGREIRQLIPNVPPLPAITGDRDLLGLAFYNLLDNALKFTRPPDAVEVRLREDGRGMLLEFADSGPGIAAEDLPHLFEALYRGANARGIEGSGLGLALTQRIVNLHGGTLQVTSRPGGTVFALHLPVSKL